jgi:hypothetical protein
MRSERVRHVRRARPSARSRWRRIMAGGFVGRTLSGIGANIHPVCSAARAHTHTHRFVSSFKPEWRLDREMILIIMCIALFAPVPTLLDHDGVASRRRAYVQLLIGFVAATAHLTSVCIYVYMCVHGRLGRSMLIVSHFSWFTCTFVTASDLIQTTEV